MASTNTGGLSRRRGGPVPSGSGSSNPSGNNPIINNTSSQLSPNSSRPNTPLDSTSSAGGSSSAGNSVGGSGSSGGHKIAFDQRDMESGEEAIMPKLTIMEEVLLLGLKDKQVSFMCICIRL